MISTLDDKQSWIIARLNRVLTTPKELLLISRSHVPLPGLSNSDQEPMSLLELPISRASTTAGFDDAEWEYLTERSLTSTTRCLA